MTMAEESYIKIGTDGLDVADIVRQIRERADSRRNNGEFDMNALARAERFNLSSLSDDEDFFERFAALHEELRKLDAEAEALAKKIDANFRELMG